MKRMLFNATHPEEIRVALVDGQRLLDLDIESTSSNLKKGNIYKARVTRIEPSLEAAFVDYGSDRQGFLPLKEVSRHYFSEEAQGKSIHKISITDALSEGQEILVQIDKEERGNKGAALTTFISLAGRFIVLMPNNPKGGGISRRIAGEEREIMREILNSLDIPNDHSVILRTAGMGRSEEEINWDADFLMKLWQAIESAAKNETAPKLIYQDSSVVVRALRDYLRDDIKEVIIDDADVYDRALKFVNLVMPERNTRIKHYEDTVPLLARYQVEQQIEAAFSREVRLPSGGAIVIDHTEAVVTIDINSAKSTKGGDIEETALHTNLEAAEEIASQLKIRDIGGLIVIDFIDMQASKNQRKVEQTLSSLVKTDRARVQIGKISKFGLLEMSRQRIRGALVESNYHTCPRCNGNGVIRGVVSSALSILRIIEEEALKENTEAVLVHLPVDSATYLLNEKRYDLALMERRLATRVTLVPNNLLETPNFKIERLRGDEYGQIANIPSHRIELDDESITEPNALRPVVLESAAVQMDEVTQSIAPAPVNKGRPPRKPKDDKGQNRNQSGNNTHRAQKNSPQEETSESKGVLGFVSRLFGGSKKEQESRERNQMQHNDDDQKDGQPNRSNQRNNRNQRAGQRNKRGGQQQRRNNRNNRPKTHNDATDRQEESQNNQGNSQNNRGNQNRNNRRRKPHQNDRNSQANAQQNTTNDVETQDQPQESSKANTTNRNRRAHQRRTQHRKDPQNTSKEANENKNVSSTETQETTNNSAKVSGAQKVADNVENQGDNKPKTRSSNKSAGDNKAEKPKSTRTRKPRSESTKDDAAKPTRTPKKAVEKTNEAIAPEKDIAEKPKRTSRSTSKKEDASDAPKKARAPRKTAASANDKVSGDNSEKPKTRRRTAQKSSSDESGNSET